MFTGSEANAPGKTKSCPSETDGTGATEPCTIYFCATDSDVRRIPPSQNEMGSLRLFTDGHAKEGRGTFSKSNP